MNKDYYEILGISKDANIQEIKKKYKELALKHHPDKGGDPEKFKEISHAYETLSNDEKRNLYDKYGENPPPQGFPMNGFPFDLFNMKQGMGQNFKKNIKKCDTKIIEINVTLEDLYNNKLFTKNIELNKLCSECNGNGFKKTAKKNNCKECSGKGFKINIQQIGPMILQQQTQCNKCNGEGSYIEDKDKCEKCNNKKVLQYSKKFEIKLNSTMHHKQQIQFENSGDEFPENEKGDIIFIIIEQTHKYFKRINKLHLYCKLQINLAEALLGTSTQIVHLDGRVLHININGIVQPNTIKQILCEGMEKNENSKLILEFEIDFPKTIDNKYLDKIQKIFKQKINQQHNNFLELQDLNKDDYKKEKNINHNNHNNEEGKIECNQQ